MASFGEAGDGGVELNLMPMVDIFSILITFLLMTFSADPVTYDVSQGVELPKSETLMALDQLPAIFLTPTEIKIEDKSIVAIDPQTGDIDPSLIYQDSIKAVYDELENMRITKLKREGLPDDAGNVENAGALAMEVDKRHKFKLIKRVMIAAQQTAFIKLKLIVNKPLN